MDIIKKFFFEATFLKIKRLEKVAFPRRSSKVFYCVYEWLRSKRFFCVVLLDSVLILFSLMMAFQIRFDFLISPEQRHLFFKVAPIVLISRMGIFLLYRLHSMFWRYVSLPDFLIILKLVTLSSLIATAVSLLFLGHGFPRGVLILDWVLCLFFICGIRICVRVGLESIGVHNRKSLQTRRILIIGAGDAGQMLTREIHRGVINGYQYQIAGFLDDDPFKQRIKIQGCEVLGKIEEISVVCQEQGIDELFIALPGVNHDQRQKILFHCQQSGLPYKTVPSLRELCGGKARISQVHEINPEDILDREPVKLNHNKLLNEIMGKCILVTGAGGSIGSELCRQLAEYNPESIILYERAESNLYLLGLELERKYPSVKMIPFVGDILNQQLLEYVIREHSPELIFHAAAYKHVSLMEAYPLEGINNNVFGSEAVGRAAINGGVKKVVFISTDKAVKPVGIMGMTKRVSECFLQTLGDRSTKFVAVRFGNVLGSDGSVLPIFKDQIERGGPLTVTDTRATRYFMLISEAAKLVIQSGVFGHDGEIYFLDMGKPVRIIDMAEKLIRLSGYEIGKDVSVKELGLRPGERLQEDLVMEKEILIPTNHEKIFGVQSQSIDLEAFFADMTILKHYVEQFDEKNSVAILKKMAARY